MVTLRRDVAVQNNNRIFDRIENLTNYDVFMREKRMSEVNRSSSACASQAISRNSFDLNDYTYFSAPQVSVIEPKVEVNDSYDDYMRSQLHRSSGEERILSEDEYYQAKYAESVGTESVKVRKETKKARRSLTKFGKIFVGVYVLLTVAVASTILAVNLGKGESVKTKANAGANDGISALAMEFEGEEGNWFDDVCDAVSNK